MISFRTSTCVEVRSAVIFDIFADIETVPERVDRIVKLEKLTTGDVGVGTRFRETCLVFKREVTEELEFAQFTSGSSYTVGCQSFGCECSTRFDLLADRSGTRVNMGMKTYPLTFVAKLSAPLGVLFAGAMTKCMA